MWCTSEFYISSILSSITSGPLPFLVLLYQVHCYSQFHYIRSIAILSSIILGPLLFLIPLYYVHCYSQFHYIRSIAIFSSIILGPLLFLYYVNDLQNVLKRIKPRMFADGFFSSFFLFVQMSTSYTLLHHQLMRAFMHIASLETHTTLNTYNLWKLALRDHRNTDVRTRDRTRSFLFTRTMP